jgi:putative tryptophan/tyrosine transport system substrate-binding protein
LGGLAQALVDDGARVIVAVGGAAARAALGVTTAPVVAIAGDPATYGLATSYARPGGRMTGVAVNGADHAAKWIEALRETVPTAARAGVLHLILQGQTISDHQIQLEAMKGPARILDLALVPIAVTEPETIDATFATMRREKLDGAIVLSSAVFHGHKQRIIAAAARERVPTVYEHRDFTEAGGLVSYGPDFRRLFGRLAYFVDRIAKGAQPRDLPIELPDRFELIVNLKTARAMGMSIPQSLLARADEVIE